MEDALLENPPPPPFSSISEDLFSYFNDSFVSQAPSVLLENTEEPIINSSSSSSDTPTSPGTPNESSPILLSQPPQQIVPPPMNFIPSFSEVFVPEPQEQPLKELVEIKPDPVATAFETINEAHAKKHTRKKRKLNDSKAQAVESSTIKGSVKKAIDPNNLLKLSREELSGLSSQEFEEYVRQLTAQRELTAEELKELKRQRRLIKNRESAHASRQRKKNYVEALEAQVANLATENANLKERITSLSTENTKLKEEVCTHFQIFVVSTISTLSKSLNPIL
jgi:regulator of replication initiation timing